MKKTMISTTLFSLLATTTLLSAGQIQAAPTDVDGKTTDAAVVFTEKSNPLVITAVPDFHFGSHEIDRSADQDLAAVASGSHIGTANTLTTSNVVSIQDDRSQAKLDGWDLQVAQTDFANAGTTDASDAIFLHVPKTINPTDKAHYQSDITWTLIASPNS